MCPLPQCRLGRFQLCISPSSHTSLPSSQAPLASPHFSLPSKGCAAAGDTLTSHGQGQGWLSHSKDAHVYGA